MSKSAAVFGATGDQGDSVVKSLLKAGYKVTGFTRDTSAPKAQGESSRPSITLLSCLCLALEKLGVETVKADLNDPESYKAALQGKDAVFVNADCESTHFVFE